MKQKTFLFSIFIYLLFNQSAFAQNCFNITLESQQQIDNFAINYPGCTEITGGLTIEENASGEITSLVGLSQITSIRNDLMIRGNDSLKTLTGLENIALVRLGDISIRNSYALHSLEALNGMTLFEEDLIYTIRFQNTGNDEAYDVVILDTLDTYLDPSSFKILSTSHPKNLLASLEADRYLTFSFKNIFLPDSTTDFEGSQGYVNYMITPIDGLAEQTKIYNRASIYFDQNPPVVTNTTENILMSDTTSIVELEGVSIRLFPNPFSEQLYLQSAQDLDGMIQLLDLNGRLLMQRMIEGNTEIDLSQQPKGYYYLRIKIGNQLATKKVVKL